jgi:hypothetical protein
MYDTEDSLKNDLLSGGAAVVLGYALASWQKKKPGTLLPTLTGFIGGSLLFATRKAPSLPPWLQACMESAGYAGFTWAGEAIACNTTTIGQVAAGPLQINRATATSTSSVRSALPGVRPVARPGIAPAPMNPGWNPWNELGYPS